MSPQRSLTKYDISTYLADLGLFDPDGLAPAAVLLESFNDYQRANQTVWDMATTMNAQGFTPRFGIGSWPLATPHSLAPLLEEMGFVRTRRDGRSFWKGISSSLPVLFARAEVPADDTTR